MSGFWKRRRKHIALLAVVALLLMVLAVLAFPHQILCVDSGERKADVIVLLGGGAHERPERAAELFRAGVAPRIIITGAGDADANRQLLIADGVPEAAIEMESKSKSTRENAIFSLPLLQAAGVKRAIIVTSWYHSRRSLKCFKHYAPGIDFSVSPSYFAYARTEWSRANMRAYLFREYVKLFAYWICYGVMPF